MRRETSGHDTHAGSQLLGRHLAGAQGRTGNRKRRRCDGKVQPADKGAIERFAARRSEQTWTEPKNASS